MIRDKEKSDPLKIGCVGFLNAKPLIHDYEAVAQDMKFAVSPQVQFDVPSRLLEQLLAGTVDVALCPTFDYFAAGGELKLLPVGGIACRSTTLTVRLFSRVPLVEINTVLADTDSHTSVNLMRILFLERWGALPEIKPLGNEAVMQLGIGQPNAQQHWPEAMLLIGDKVVTQSPPAVLYPYQWDLGEAWHQLTGLPFVFALWMHRKDCEQSMAGELLEKTRKQNRPRIESIAQQYAPQHNWPIDLAERYLGRWLHYDIGDVELQAITHFGQLLQKYQLIGAQGAQV